MPEFLDKAGLQQYTNELAAALIAKDPKPATANPSVDGTAAVGSSAKYAREDHVHPTDTSRASASDMTSVTGRVTDLETQVGTGSVDTRIENAVKALDSSISAESNKAIASVTITDGKISAHTKATVPTKTSELTNDSTFQTASDVSSAIANKVDKENGKGLSTNDYTTAEKNKLSGIAAGAEVNVQADWNESSSSSDAYIKNKPTIPQASSTTPAMDGTASAGSGTTWARADHVHPKDTSKIGKGDELQTTNPFAPYSLQGVYISKIDNALYAADKRWNVTATNETGNIGLIFDGSYETGIEIRNGDTSVITLTFPNESSGYFPGYPYGYILLSFYYTCKPASVSGRVYCNYSGHGIGWHDITFEPMADNQTAAIVYRARQGYYAISTIEVTIVGDTTNSYGYTRLTQMEMHLDRPEASRNPFLSKYAAETLYYPLTAPSFNGDLNGNASTATTATNSLNASTTSPKMDGTATVGTEANWAHGDHIHPTDTSRASASDLTAVSGRVTTLETDVGTGSVDTRISNAIGALDSSISAETNKAIASVTITNGKISAHTKTAIPTKVSDLTNDSGFQTASDVSTAIANKVDKETGKGLSSNDYTTTEKNKLAGIASGAEVNVQSNWNETNTSSDAYIQNKPAIPSKVSDLTNDAGFITSNDNITGTASNVTGIVSIAHGGTGQTTGENAANVLLNSLSVGSSDPTDNDYYISQYAGGGTTTTTYHRRPLSRLWNYIKGKISSILGISSTTNGIPLAPTAAAGTNTTQIATTAFVKNAVPTAGSGLSMSGTTLNHSNSVTAGTAGTSSATSSTNGTLAVPYFSYDAQGHVTGSGTHTHTLTSYPEGNLAWGGNNAVGNVTPLGASLSAEHSANRIAFLHPNAIQIEYTQDGGTTWQDSGYTDTQRMWLCTGGQAIWVGQSAASGSISTPATTGFWTRITLTGQDGTHQYVYTAPRKLLVNMSTALQVQCLVEYKTGASGAAWQTFGTYTVSGWSGWNDIPLILGTFGGGATQTSNNWYLRFTFKVMNTRTDSYKGLAQVSALRLFGATDWTSASSANGKGVISSTGHLYSFDSGANATFPAQITATQFNGVLNGTASTASNVNNTGAATANVARHVWFSDGSTESRRCYSDSFTYNPVGNIISANTSGNAATSTRALNASNATPLANGTASAGTSTDFARADHVHPSEYFKLTVTGETTAEYDGETVDVFIVDVAHPQIYSLVTSGKLPILDIASYYGSSTPLTFVASNIWYNGDTNAYICGSDDTYYAAGFAIIAGDDSEALIYMIPRAHTSSYQPFTITEMYNTTENVVYNGTTYTCIRMSRNIVDAREAYENYSRWVYNLQYYGYHADMFTVVPQKINNVVRGFKCYYLDKDGYTANMQLITSDSYPNGMLYRVALQ